METYLGVSVVSGRVSGNPDAHLIISSALDIQRLFKGYSNMFSWYPVDTMAWHSRHFPSVYKRSLVVQVSSVAFLSFDQQHWSL
jgi:hypothetical protein